MMELLWLLLPVAAASGWLAAKRSGKPKETPGYNGTPSYFRGLNYLLNEQPDKAIDVFVEMLEVDSETVETHLALGNLFRRRGEVDRAIRIHQNLIARPTLSRDQRAQGLLELGQDYMRAGLFDRAENLFTELGEMNMYQEQALENLRVIYQQEKDWDKCLQVSARLEQISGRSLGTERAHFYCELAEEALSVNDADQARTFLKKAQGCDGNCVRATILLGEMEASAGSCKTAIRTFKRIENQDLTYIAEALPTLLECYRQVGSQNELMDYLRHLIEKDSGIATALALVDLIQEKEGEKSALRFLNDYLQHHPDLEGLDRLIGLNLSAGGKRATETLGILQQLLGRVLEEHPSYLCSHCGFTAKTLHWQCPGCKWWGSIKPVRSPGQVRHH